MCIRDRVSTQSTGSFDILPMLTRPSSQLFSRIASQISRAHPSPACVSSGRSYCAASSAQKTPLTVRVEEKPTTPNVSDDLETPAGVVKHLDRFIVGQHDAKRAVAIAMRNRWRRHRVPDDLKDEIAPKNILMIGPTGCGKTEIARRLAKLVDAPFIKVEATKFTEVGFHGRDVDHIIRDLVEISLKQTKQRLRKKLADQVDKLVEERIIDALCGPHSKEHTRESFRTLLRDGMLNDRKVDLELPSQSPQSMQVDPNPNLNEVVIKLDKMMGGRNATQKRSMTIAEARPLVEETELEKLMSPELITKEAIQAVEQDGVVFLDEIDKICSSAENRHGADASAEGVQRDLLPLVEGCSINTKHGNVNTDHILFLSLIHISEPTRLLSISYAVFCLKKKKKTKKHRTY
eukprot:TRINITY_DN1738_c0_g1_i2.p1 TRINITY_DN1738_c0_g1~~TRINITY_DN1738_c0_g1_i2.p1  ORF type:complete len:405 (+),score=100.40 TRINITY_DN1738_c0_g1_i2:142-1356(+)